MISSENTAQILRLKGHYSIVLVDLFWPGELMRLTFGNLRGGDVDNLLSTDQLNSAFTPPCSLLVIMLFNPASRYSQLHE